MRGEERADRVVSGAGALVGRLMPEGSVFAFLPGIAGMRLLMGEFEDLFLGQGCPSIVTSQTLHGLSDWETVEMPRLRLAMERSGG